MLTESQVIQKVCAFLENNHFRIISSCSETEHGIDIEAVAPNGRIASIEAKGETSSQHHTNRYGEPFSPGQVRHHVSVALYAAARHFGTGKLAGLALPKNVDHQKCIEKILPALRQLQIEVFWVTADGTVNAQHGLWAQFTAGSQVLGKGA